MDWFMAVFFGFSSLVQGTLQFAFSGWFTRRQPKAWQYPAYLLAFLLCNRAGAVFPSFLLPEAANILTLYGANRLLLRNGRPLSALTAMLAAAIPQLSFGVCNALTALFLPYAEAGIPMSWLIPVAATTAALFLCLCCCRIVKRYFALAPEQSNQYLFLLSAPALFFSVMGFYIVNTAYGNVVEIPFPADPEKHLELLAMQLIGLCTLFSTLFAYRKLCDSFQIKSRLACLEQEVHAQKAYVLEAKARYEQTRAFRHDVKNHLAVLDGLIKAGQTAEAAAYLERLEAVTGAFTPPVQTGNPVVDVLLGSKLACARQCGIGLEFSLALPKPCAVDDFDLCVIFSNALDNAIAACALAVGQKAIRITGEQQGDFFLLVFENSCPPGQAAIPEPGTGLSNIKTVAEKYRGAIAVERQPTRFRLDILLNIS